jgi:serine O-acetyltransferase
MLNRMKEDIQTVFAKDPAARTVWEILCCYPGLHATWFHRLAHALWTCGLRFLGRLVSHVGRALTKRHPTIADHVVIGAGATILGPITVGDGARIGAGSVVIKPVPPGTTVVGVPGHIAGLASSTESETDLLEHGQLPDPVLRTLSEILERQSKLEEKLGRLEETLPRVELPQLVGANGGSNGPGSQAGICSALRDVIDPEVGVNVVDLGLIREIKRNGDGVEIRMVLTSPAHPMAGYLVEQVRRKARQMTDGKSVEVVLLDEAWRWEDRAPHLCSGGGI